LQEMLTLISTWDFRSYFRPFIPNKNVAQNRKKISLWRKTKRPCKLGARKRSYLIHLSKWKAMDVEIRRTNV
jgi:hypothetical protein